jgi:hypothetical protein
LEGAAGSHNSEQIPTDPSFYDDIIDNDGTLEDLRRYVHVVMSKFRSVTSGKHCPRCGEQIHKTDDGMELYYCDSCQLVAHEKDTAEKIPGVVWQSRVGSTVNIVGIRTRRSTKRRTASSRWCLR